MRNNAFLIIILLLLLFTIIYFDYTNDNKSLCKSGDFLCRKNHGKNYFCSLWEEKPMCMIQNGNNFTKTDTPCECSNDTNDSYLIYVVLMFVILFLLSLVIFCNLPRKISTEDKLRFMFT